MFRTQKDTIRKGIQNNAGFTLIEMIVTVAIIAIFSGVVVTLIGTGSNLFRGVSGNTKSQIDAQETLNAIEDLIIDANRSVYYAYGSGTDMGEQIRSDIDDSNATSKTFITCNEYENGDGTSRYVFDVLDWVGSEGKLYYSQRQYTKASSSTEEKDENGSGENPESQHIKNERGTSGENAENIDIAVAAEGDEENQTGIISGNGSDTARDSKELIKRSVFAEGIENFTADVTKVESERIVRFRLTTENNGKKVKTLHTVNLRNRIQVLKPDDAFATAGSTDIRITIVGAPDSIDVGNSKILSYDASGPIDPTTVVWKITDGADKGSFPVLDPTYGKLTVNNNATGTITVTVSARTADGKQTATSAPVTIRINNNRIVTGIETETKSVLVAAGYNGLDLNSEINWKYVYSDGTKGEDNVPVSWTMDKPDNCSYAIVTSAGQISVGSEAGTADKGSFTVRATNSEHNVSNTITVKIARIDLSLPGNNATYTVGTKKELHCTYMEGGQVVETIDGNNTSAIVNITTTKKPENASDYNAGGNFAENDIGEWKVKAEVDLSGRTGYDITCGVVKDMSAFTVIAATADIYVNGDSSVDALVVGRTYDCMATIEYGFNWRPVSLDVLWNKNSQMRWYLKNNPEGISIDSTEYAYPNTVRHITIGENVRRGFIICADFKKDNGDGTSIQLHAEREIKVVNGIQLTSLNGDTAYAYEKEDFLYSKGYEMKLLLNVYDVNGHNVPLCVSPEDGTQVDWTGRGSNGEIMASSDKMNWLFMPNVNDVNRTLQLTASIQRVASKYGIFDRNNNYYGDEKKGNTIADFKKFLSVKISEPKFTARIIPGEDETVEPATTKEMYLELLDENGNAVKRNVEWTVKDTSSGHLSKSTTDTGADQTTIFSADKPGTYTVTATYKTVPGISHSINKTITVRKPEVNLTLHGLENGYNNDTANYWLEVTVDGKNMADMQVTWTTDWAGNLNRKESTVGENNAVQVTFHSDATACKITASVNVAGEDINISKNVTLRKHEYTLEVIAVDPNTNAVINSCVSGTNVKFVVKAYLDGNQINDCQVTWSTWNGKFNIYGNTATYTIGNSEKSISFQVQVTGNNKTQCAEVRFDENGVTIVNRW